MIVIMREQSTFIPISCPVLAITLKPSSITVACADFNMTPVSVESLAPNYYVALLGNEIGCILDSFKKLLAGLIIKIFINLPCSHSQKLLASENFLTVIIGQIKTSNTILSVIIYVFAFCFSEIFVKSH